MAKKYRYQLVINNRIRGDKREFVYKYRNTKDIRIVVNSGNAYIDVYMGTKKEFEDFSNASFDLMVDAIKKIYLLHILIYKQGLKINKYTLYRDEESYTYNDSDHRFPYVFSMAEDVKYHFDDTWNNDTIINNILTSTKSSRINDSKYIALYAYLTSQPKKYRIDKFTQLWMSFNAYYNYNASINGERAGRDKACIEYLLKCINHGNEIKYKSYRDHNKTLYEQIISELAHIEDCEKFYNTLYNKEDIEGFESLKELCSDNLSMYGAVLCEIAYTIRCKYFHGNKTITLFSTYNEREVNMFRVLNYFLDRFLIEYIPSMFI